MAIRSLSYEAHEQQERTAGRWWALLCALMLVALVLLAKPYAEMGTNDDWAYAWMARNLAATGHIHYNGWASPILGWQLYWGELFIRMAGFSFTTLRFSILVVAVLVVFLMHRLFARCGLSPRNTTLATLAICLSPVFFPLAFSFMTDMGGLFALVLCFYCCVRAVQSPTVGGAACWLIVAAASNIVLGTVRQIGWLGILVVVPSAAWLLRGKGKLLQLAFMLWIIGLVCIAGVSHWFGLQPHILREPILAGSLGSHRLAALFLVLVRSGLVLSLLLLPVLVSFLLPSRRVPRSVAQRRVPAAVFVTVLLTLSVLAMYLIHTHHSLRMITPFSNNLVTARGMVDLPDLLGHRPEVVPVWVRVLLLSLSAAVVASFLLTMQQRQRPFETIGNRFALTRQQFVVLFGPFTACYLALLVTRVNLFDRYLLPVLLVGTIIVIRLYQRHVRRDLTLLAEVGVLVFACFSVAALHDLYATSRARIAATERLQSAGLTRKEIRGGFEYDGWTQLEAVGYVVDTRVQEPFKESPGSTAINATPSSNCTFWFSSETPVVQERYGLSYEPMQCGTERRFTAVPYRTWLPPHERSIYIESMR